MPARTARLLPTLALACAGIAACTRTAAVDEAALRAVVGDTPVVLLSAAWCGYCSRQREDFRRWGVAFDELDVEDDPAGARAYALLRGRGVPIVLVNEHRIRGYAPPRVRELLAESGLLPASAPR
jgi:glutaredoxin